MKAQMVTLDNKPAGDITLNDDVFKVEVRPDIMARMVTWQLAKRRAGTHKTKRRNEVVGSTRKFVRQKGSGGARHGNRKATQFRGGGIPFGPAPRSHEFSLPKKVRALALRSVLSMKASEGKLIIIDDVKLASAKTKDLLKKFEILSLNNALIVAGTQLDDNFSKAVNNIPHIDSLPYQGANVYDILRFDMLVLTKDAVSLLEERLG